MKVFAIVVFSILANVWSLEAATYYVATTGSDTSTGTQTSPFKTLNRAVKVLKPGDTLYVRAGTYAEYLDNTIPGGTSWSSPVTVAAYSGETVTIRPPSGSERVIMFAGSSTQYIIIDGFILDAVNVSYDVVKISDNYGTGEPHHIRIKNSELKNARNNGVLMGGTIGGNEFINLHVHDNGLFDFNPYGHGFYVASPNNLIDSCNIHDNGRGKWGGGIQVYSSGHSDINNNTIRNNKIYHHLYGAALVLGSGSGNKAYNNVIYNGGGISIGFAATNTKVYNNSIFFSATGVTTYGIEVRPDSTSAEVRNNITYNAGTGIQNSGVSTTLSNNLVGVDPKFVDASSGDLRVQLGSPAIDAGMAVTTVTTDLSGTARPQGSGVDIGAYEYQATSATVAAPKNLRKLP